MPLHQVPQSWHAERGSVPAVGTDFATELHFPWRWYFLQGDIINEMCYYSCSSSSDYVRSLLLPHLIPVTLLFHNKGVRLDRVRGGRQKYKRRPEVENATYQSAPLPLTKESEKGGCLTGVLAFFTAQDGRIWGFKNQINGSFSPGYFISEQEQDLKLLCCLLSG